MKTRTWIVILAIILAASIGLSIFTLMPGEDAVYAEISSYGKVTRVISLQTDQVFQIRSDSGFNTVTVKDGKIAVTEATCPDHYCMQRGYCSSGTPIVCLPNRLVIRFVGEQPIDAVVG